MSGGAAVTMEVVGLDDLLGAFDALGRLGTKAALQGAMKKGAQIIADEAGRLAPRGEDIGPRRAGDVRLHDSIRVAANVSRSQRSKRGAPRGEAEYFVGSTDPTAHLVEFGHLLVKATREETPTSRTFTRRRRRKDGSIELVQVRGKATRHILGRRVIGHVAAHPFMRPAFDSTRVEATKIVMQELGGEVVKVAKRYRRQAESGKLTRGSRQAFQMGIA